MVGGGMGNEDKLEVECDEDKEEQQNVRLWNASLKIIIKNGHHTLVSILYFHSWHLTSFQFSKNFANIKHNRSIFG